MNRTPTIIRHRFLPRPWRLRLFAVITIAAIWLLALPAQPVAAFDPPPWRQSLSCESEPKFQGIEYCTAADDRIHVIVSDLHSPGVGLEYVIAEGINRDGFGECKDVNVPTWGPVRGGCVAKQEGDDKEKKEYYPVMSLSEAMQRFPEAAIIIDSDYGAGTQGKPGEYRGHGPEGLTVVRGDRLDGPKNGDFDAPGNDPDTNNAVRRPWLVVSEHAPLHVEIGQFKENTDYGSKPEEWVYTGVGQGFPVLKSTVMIP